MTITLPTAGTSPAAAVTRLHEAIARQIEAALTTATNYRKIGLDDRLDAETRANAASQEAHTEGVLDGIIATLKLTTTAEDRARIAGRVAERTGLPFRI